MSKIGDNGMDFKYRSTIERCPARSPRSKLKAYIDGTAVNGFYSEKP
jgi:hypothetical protein